MVAQARLPNLTSGQSLDTSSASADELLLRQEQCRVGTMIVRFSRLKPHTQQRPISIPWVLELASNHFDEGRNINKAAFPLVILAAEGDEFALDSTPEKLPYAPEDREFFLISGQHRVMAMKHLIKQRCERENGAQIHPADVLDEPDAEWPAIVYSKEFETRSPTLFKIFIDSFNIAPPMLENDPGQLWASASALQVTEGSAVAEKYIRAVISGTSNQKAVIKALNNSRLRPAIDRLLQIPMMDFVWSHTCTWTGAHCATLWAGVIQEATHGLSRLTRGDEVLRQNITNTTIFGGRPPRLYKKDDFEDLALSMKTSGARWRCLVTRDLDYESLLHSKGDDETIIPWMWSKFLLTSPSSPLLTWVLNMKRLLQVVLLIWCDDPPALHPTDDIYDVLNGFWEDEPFSVDDVIRFCAKHLSDLMVILDAVWPKSQDDGKKDQLGTTTRSPFTTQLAKFKTVLEAISYQVKMNDYWWALAKILVANRFDQGEYHLLSGTVVYEQEPHFFVEEERQAISLAERSLETSKKASDTGKLAAKAKRELQKIEQSAASLRAQAESKEAEVEKLKRDESLARTQGEKLKGEALKIIRKASGRTPNSQPRPLNNPGSGTPGSSVVSTFDLPRREPVDSLPPPKFSSLKEGGVEGSQEKEVARSLIQLRVLREYVGKERLSAFQTFLEQLLREDVLNKVCDSKVDLTSLLPKSEETPLAMEGSSGKPKLIDLTTILEDGEESGNADRHEEDGKMEKGGESEEDPESENNQGSEDDQGSDEDYVDPGSNRGKSDGKSDVQAESAVEAEGAAEPESEDEGLENRIKTMSLEPEVTSGPRKRKTAAERGVSIEVGDDRRGGYDVHVTFRCLLSGTMSAFVGDETMALMMQESHRLGACVVRFSNIGPHHLQRSLDVDWALKLAQVSFQGGENVQKWAYPLYVISEDDGKMPLGKDAEKLPCAPEGKRFLVISGQHRVAAMKHVIRSRLEKARMGPVSEQDVLDDEEAEWPAIVFGKSMEVQGEFLVQYLMHTQNIRPAQLAQTCASVWYNSRALFEVGNIDHAKKYIDLMGIGGTTTRPIIKALKEPRLRKAIDKILKYPFMDDFSLTGIWAGVLEEAAYGLERLCPSELNRAKMTRMNIFQSESQQLFRKDDFLSLADEVKDTDSGLWAEFSPELRAFEERWNMLVSRDENYDGLLHQKGRRFSVIPWMWSKFLLSGTSSPLVLWAEKLKSILNVVCLLFSEEGNRNQASPSFDAYLQLQTVCGFSVGKGEQALQFCATYNEELCSSLGKAWDGKLPLTRETESSYTTRLCVQCPTVLDAFSHIIRVDEYWRRLCMFLGVSFDGTYGTLPSGIALLPDSPDDIRAQEDEAVNIASQWTRISKRAETIHKTAEETGSRLTAVKKHLGDIRKKEKSMNGRLRILQGQVKKLHTQGLTLKHRAKDLVKAVQGRFISIYMPHSPLMARSFFDQGTPSTSSTRASPTAKGRMTSSNLPPPSTLPTSTPSAHALGMMAESESPQRDIVQSMIGLPTLRSHLGPGRLEPFRKFLELILCNDTLLMMLDESVTIDAFIAQLYSDEDEDMNPGSEGGDALDPDVEGFFLGIQHEVMDDLAMGPREDS
ncbi:hypothetical protein BS47DRAFT_1392879 [Hydnum rufescens UP504]|uniref:Uncharacterized protein n=1 Tax=Hydnum rufescens UP504 TaxID=1448309 RepID=A0A9P6AXT5_9AGAM|nr:hypothetical protein BS47DRAFT_1392879 [Hydnum rufescens UP504]